MTEKQSNALVKNPNTKKAIAVLQRFALKEAEYKALEKESKEATEVIKQAMIDGGIDKLEFDPDKSGLSGFITLAERTSYKLAEGAELDEKYAKTVLDTDKVKAETVLTGKLPEGIEESRTKYVIKKFKVVE